MFLNLFIYIYFWLCWVFASVRGLSPVAASGGHSSSRGAGLSPSRPLPLRSTGSRRAGSVAVAHGLSRSVACRIFPDQGSNPCPLHWQADSQPLHHQGSPGFHVFRTKHFSEQDLQSSSFPAGFLRKILLPTQISGAQEWNGWISMFLLPDGVLLSQKSLEAEM